ncbi:MAG: amidohydrolase family protein [Acidobacteria bacterium]|nr:amidohydrolase family protein [Acidobacteriota bacterium]
MKRCRAALAVAAGVALAMAWPSARQRDVIIDVIIIEAERLVTATAAPALPGFVLVRDGKIESVSRTIPRGVEGARRLKARVVTPGLIDARTTLGLAGLTPVDDESNEASAPNQAHLRAVDAYNLREPLLRAALQSGVTTVQTGPGRADSIGGQVGIFHTAGESVSDATIRFPSALVLSLTEAAKTTYAGAAPKVPTTRMANVGLIRQAFVDAGQYARRLKDAKPPDRDLKHDALVEVLERRIPALVTAERVDEIATALRLRDEFGFRLLLAGANDATLIADRLASNQVPVLAGPPTDGPVESGTPQERARVPALLDRAGVRFAIVSGDGRVRPRVTLLQQVAGAVASGLPADAALSAVTIHAARILGLDDRLGSIERGKDADLVLFDGDPLSYATHVTAVLIGGRVVFERSGS